jgi:hypothetical protein
MAYSLWDFCDVPPGLPDNAVVIRDIGHDKGHLSITNDAEYVVKFLIRAGLLSTTTRLFYYDSEGTLDELCHDGSVFTGFKTGPRQ